MSSSLIFIDRVTMIWLARPDSFDFELGSFREIRQGRSRFVCQTRFPRNLHRRSASKFGIEIPRSRLKHRDVAACARGKETLNQTPFCLAPAPCVHSYRYGQAPPAPPLALREQLLEERARGRLKLGGTGRSPAATSRGRLNSEGISMRRNGGPCIAVQR